LRPEDSAAAILQIDSDGRAAACAIISGHLTGKYIFPTFPGHYFQAYSQSKRLLDELSGIHGWRLHDLRRTIVCGMARMGIPPHVTNKILNHQSGTISGVAAVYQRHDFLRIAKTH
jgi:integrase